MRRPWLRRLTVLTVGAILLAAAAALIWARAAGDPPGTFLPHGLFGLGRVGAA